MLWVEVDQATGERRLHTAESLALRIKALGITSENPVSKRSWFRESRGDEETRLPRACADGSWGPITRTAPCATCKGTGKVEHHDELTRDVAKCWRCGGKGMV